MTLKVTPQINERRFVKLKIYQEISRVISETTQISPSQVVLAPTTTKRTAETNVQVRDGQTVVIAGLMGDNVDVSTTKVPCLGDIPILGWLFKSESRNTTRTNLLIFLTPYIVATPEEAEEIYRQKASYMDELTRSATDQDVQPEEPSPARGPATSSSPPGSGEAEDSQKKK